jgi:hypothetical protein
MIDFEINTLLNHIRTNYASYYVIKYLKQHRAISICIRERLPRIEHSEAYIFFRPREGIPELPSNSILRKYGTITNS